MKRILFFSYLLLFGLQVFAQKKVLLQPKKSVGKVVLVGKADYTYYALSETSQTTYSVVGPGKLILNFRARVANGQFKSSPMQIKMLRSGKHLSMVDVPALLSSNLKLKAKTLSGQVTRMHRVEVDVPPGKHSFRFYRYQTTQKACIRAFYKADHKPSWVDIVPNSWLSKKEVKFSKSGTLRTYQSITKQLSFDFSVKDTALIRVIVRPEFTYSMLSEATIKLKLTNTKTGKTAIYKVNARRSNKLEFTDPNGKTTPGTKSTFYLNLPKPKGSADSYSLALVSGAKSAIVRLSEDQKIQ